MIVEFTRQALLSLTRRKLRTILTTFGIFVGIVTIVTMVALAAGVQREVTRNVEELGLDSIQVYPRVQETGLPRGPFLAPRQKPITPEVVEQMRKVPGVTAAQPVVSLPGSVDLRIVIGNEEVQVAAVVNNRSPMGQLAPPIIAGEAVDDRQRGVVVSRGALARLGYRTSEDYGPLLGKQVALVARTSRGESQTFPVTLVGVRDSAQSQVNVGYLDASEIVSWWYDDPGLLEKQGFDMVVLHAASLGMVPAIGEAINRMGFNVTSVQTVLDVVNRLFAILQAMLASIGGLALFVASLGVANTMLMAVYERTREIGIMKATGASRGDVIRLFLIEAGMMGAIGGLAGLAGGWLLSLFVDWLAHLFLESQQVTFIGSLSYVPLWLAIGSLAFAVLVGVVAGLYPAFRAASLDPVSALRHD